MYRAAGNQLTAPARSSLLVGLVMLFISAVFLFDLNWSLFGPILLILAGIAILVTYMTSRQ
jgi:hypothetical protein